MIAWAGLEHLSEGAQSDMDATPRPRWPLDNDSAPIIGSGKKGAKA
jgi:N6-L-threonylcarbamoyladenine synthase